MNGKKVTNEKKNKLRMNGKEKLRMKDFEKKRGYE